MTASGATRVAPEARPPGGPAGTRVRRPVAVIVSRFPLITETFILREIEELERQGQPVVLVPLIREHGGVTHHEAKRWIDRILYVPFFSPDVVSANVRMMRTNPRGYGGALVEAVLGSAHSANVLLRTLALFPKTVCLAMRLSEQGIRHAHAHFATYPAGAALAIARLGGPSYSFTAHAHDIFVPWRRASLRRKVERARFVRTIAAHGREQLRSCCDSDAAAKIEVIHVGVRPQNYEIPAAARERGTPTLLCVAALKPYKGQTVLLDACQRLKRSGRRFRCEIVGDGPMRPVLERLREAMDLQDCVALRGALTQDEVVAMLAAADIALAPSIVAPDGQMDGIPVFLMEAMAAGRPVVASRLSGIPELVIHEVTGLLTRPGEAADLAAAIERLLDDPGLAARMGQGGHEKVAREFTLEHSVRALLERIDAHNPGPALQEQASWRDAIGPLLPGKAIGIRRVHQRTDSTVVEVLAGDGRSASDLVMKIHSAHPLDSRSAEARAEHEFLVLTDLGSMTGHQEPATRGFTYGVPRVLARAGRALLLESCDGQLLVDRIRRARLGGRRDRAALVDAVERTGTWLRVFQQHTRRDGDAQAVLNSLIRQARHDLGACRVAPPATARISKRLESLATLAAKSVSAGRPAVGHHGDLWPGNIFVADRRITVIDFEGFRPGLPCEDVAYFLVQLELFFVHLPFVRFWRQLRDAFLRGYQGTVEVDREVYDLCRLAKALQILAGHAPADRRSGSHAQRRDRVLRRIAARG